MQKNSDNITKTLKILGNCMFVPLIIILLFCSVCMYIAKSNKQVPSLFGHSIVTVLTGSMTPDFNPGDTVIVKATPISQLKIGDIIAFYNYQLPDISYTDLLDNSNLVQYDSYDDNVNTNFLAFFGGGAANDYQKNAAKSSKVVFHKIENISTPMDKSNPFYGKIFFYTSGNTDNSTKAWIMQDYIVGKYQPSGGIISLILSISSSLVGSLMLIIIPAIAIFVILIISFIKDIKKIYNQQDN